MTNKELLKKHQALLQKSILQEREIESLKTYLACERVDAHRYRKEKQERFAEATRKKNLLTELLGTNDEAYLNIVYALTVILGLLVVTEVLFNVL